MEVKSKYLINMDMVVSINLIPSHKIDYYRYITEKNKWSLFKGFYRKPSYIVGPFESYENEEEFLKVNGDMYYIRDKSVYKKAFIYARLANGKNFEKYFNTDSEAQSFYDSFKSKINNAYEE